MMLSLCVKLCSNWKWFMLFRFVSLVSDMGMVGVVLSCFWVMWIVGVILVVGSVWLVCWVSNFVMSIMSVLL